MTNQEVAKILALCAAFDQRTGGIEDVQAWALVIGDLDAADAADAVVDWYKRNRTRIMPSDVRDFVDEVRADRLARNPISAEELTDAARFDGNEYRRQMQALRDAHAARPVQLRSIQ